MRTEAVAELSAFWKSLSAMRIAADACIYTNDNFTIEELKIEGGGAGGGGGEGGEKEEEGASAAASKKDKENRKEKK